MPHASISPTFYLLLLLLLGPWWCTLELLAILLTLISSRSLTLSLIYHLLLIVLIECKHLWRLFVSVSHLMILLLFDLMLHINVCTLLLLLLIDTVYVFTPILIYMVLLRVASCLSLEIRSFNVVVIVVSVAKSLSCGMLHISVMWTQSLWSLRSVCWVSQWLSLFNPLVNIR